MNLPEYSVLFSNLGTIDIEVHFEDHYGSMPNKKMRPKEVAALISSNGKSFHTQMTFDDCTFVITKYEIEPALNRLTIFAKQIL